MKLKLIFFSAFLAATSGIQLIEPAGRDKGDTHDNSLVDKKANHCSYSEHLRMCVIDEVQMNQSCVMAPEGTNFLVTAENRCTWREQAKAESS